jgi:hypothetical protein
MNEKLHFFQESLIIETLIIEPNLIKNAQEVGSHVSSLIEGVKNYASAHIDENDKLGSALNILGPGILFALGFRWLSLIFGIATQVFHVDIGSIFAKAVSAIKDMISSNGQVSSSQVDSTVKAATDAEFGTSSSSMESGASLSLKDAKLYKLALISFISQNDVSNDFSIVRTADIIPAFLKGKASSVIGIILSWIFKVVLASAGFMIAGDIINHLIGRPNVFDGTLQGGHEVPKTEEEQSSSNAAPKINLKVSPSYDEESYNISDIWIEPISPNHIGDEIVDWAKQIYPDLANEESEIRSSIGFNKVVSMIQKYNVNKNEDMTYIPKVFSSKKNIVDLFVPEVASKLTQ